jgi:hypothetical protein
MTPTTIGTPMTFETAREGIHARKAGLPKSRRDASNSKGYGGSIDASNSKDTFNSRCKDDISTYPPFRIPKSNEKCLIRIKTKENQ